MADAVVIVGTDPFLFDAPNAAKMWEIPDAEYWGLNNSWLMDLPMDKFTRWFEMHTWARTKRKRSAEHLAWLKREHPFPIYMPKKVRYVKQSVEYPIDEARKLVSRVYDQTTKTNDLFGCTFAYQIALAILERIPNIVLFGVNLANAVEIYMELPSVMFWIGQAAARGHSVFSYASYRGLLEPTLYGYGERKAPAWLPKSVANYLEVVEARKSEEEWLNEITTGI